MISETDEALYIRFLTKRDEEALKTLLERHREKLTLFIYGYVRDMDDAEDLMMEAFARAAAKESWSGEGSSFKTWLFSIGRKLALMYIRKRKISPVPLGEDVPDNKAVPDFDLLRSERDNHLYRALEQLNPDYRQALTLIYFEDMSHDEAAKVMNKTKKQMYHLVSRGRERLKETLKGMGFDYAQY